MKLLSTALFATALLAFGSTVHAAAAAADSLTGISYGEVGLVVADAINPQPLPPRDPSPRGSRA